MKQETREDLFMVGSVLFFVGVMLAILFPFVYFVAYTSCRQQAELLGLEYNFGFLTECYIKVDGRWEPLNWQRSVRIKEKQ